MSKISSLYDYFVARVVAVLPSHKRMPDPYLMIKNTESDKRMGFGVKFGPGEHTGNNLSCDIILRQQFSLILTRVVQAKELQGSQKAVTEKQLMEDLFLVIKDVEAEPGLQHPEVVLHGAYLSHGGIEFVEGDRDNWMKVEAQFTFRYRQDLN